MRYVWFIAGCVLIAALAAAVMNLYVVLLIAAAVGVISLLLAAVHAVSPSRGLQRISDQRCPACGAELRNVRVGETDCPNCGEPIPAPLRRWG